MVSQSCDYRVRVVAVNLARKIVSERNARGGFASITELREIAEIDENIIKTLSAAATIGTRDSSVGPPDIGTL